MAQDIFLEITGIAGESQDNKHKGAIDVESFTWGETVTINPPGGGAGAGKVANQDVIVNAKFSKASLALMLSCATGKHLQEAKLTLRRQGKSLVEYLHWTFQDVLVASYQTGATQQGNVPEDIFYLNFSKMKVEYFPTNADGVPGQADTISIDFRANKAG